MASSSDCKYNLLEKTASCERKENILEMVWRGSNLLMSVFFLLAASVQFNDPDPYVWVPLYGVAGCLTLAVVLSPKVAAHPTWKSICAVWVILCLSGLLYLTYLTILLLEGKVANPFQHEEGREMGGLLIVTAWLFICLCLRTKFTESKEHDQSRRQLCILIVATTAVGLMPLLFWGLCLVPGVGDDMHHCGGSTCTKTEL